MTIQEGANRRPSAPVVVSNKDSRVTGHWKRFHFRDTEYFYSWVWTVLIYGGFGLVVLWSLLTFTNTGLVSAPSSDASSVTQTMTSYTFEAAFTIPISILVAIVGCALVLVQEERVSQSSSEFKKRKRRLSLIMQVTGYVALVSLASALVGVVLVSVNLFGGQAVSVHTAVKVDGTVLSLVIIEVVLLYVLLTDLIWGTSARQRSTPPFDDWRDGDMPAT